MIKSDDLQRQQPDAEMVDVSRGTTFMKLPADKPLGLDLNQFQ
jgi:hypothetical protein